MLTMHPRDSGLWLRHAEVLKRLDRRAAAVTSYRQAAQLLMDAAHGRRAVACLKMALELQPGDVGLVTDIIRFELLQRQQRESQAPASTGPMADAATEPAVQPWLALPMLSKGEETPSGPPPTEGPSGFKSWPHVRRISEREVAIKPSPFAKWIVLTSSAPIEARFVEDYSVPDFALWHEDEPSR